MYCLSDNELSLFQGMTESQLEKIAKVFNISIENFKMSGGIIEELCIRSHGLYELIPLITPLLIKLSFVALTGLALHLMYTLIPSGE